MNSIDIMVEEHRQISRMLQVMRKVCYKILEGEAIEFEVFDQIIDFIKNYADTHHHGKEEKFLFNEMETHLGPVGVKLTRNGMLVEHDFGRLYVKELGEALEKVKAGDEESKLDVIANAIGYANLLARHISKENEVVYTFAARQLSEDVIKQIDKNTDIYEVQAKEAGIQEKYIKLVDALEDKYCK